VRIAAKVARRVWWLKSVEVSPAAHQIAVNQQRARTGGGKGKAQRQRQARAEADHVFGVPGSEPRTPAEPCRCGIVQKSAHRALQKSLQTGERCLAILAERQVLVRPQALEPDSEVELMAPLRKGHAILKREQISGEMEIASVVASGQAQLGRRIRSRAASHYDRAHRQPREESGQTGRRTPRRGFAREEIAGPRKAGPGRVSLAPVLHDDALSALLPAHLLCRVSGAPNPRSAVVCQNHSA